MLFEKNSNKQKEAGVVSLMVSVLQLERTGNFIFIFYCFNSFGPIIAEWIRLGPFHSIGFGLNPNRVRTPIEQNIFASRINVCVEMDNLFGTWVTWNKGIRMGQTKNLLFYKLLHLPIIWRTLTIPFSIVRSALLDTQVIKNDFHLLKFFLFNFTFILADAVVLWLDHLRSRHLIIEGSEAPCCASKALETVRWRPVSLE